MKKSLIHLAKFEVKLLLVEMLAGDRISKKFRVKRYPVKIMWFSVVFYIEKWTFFNILNLHKITFVTKLQFYFNPAFWCLFAALFVLLFQSILPSNALLLFLLYRVFIYIQLFFSDFEDGEGECFATTFFNLCSQW